MEFIYIAHSSSPTIVFLSRGAAYTFMGAIASKRPHLLLPPKAPAAATDAPSSSSKLLDDACAAALGSFQEVEAPNCDVLLENAQLLLEFLMIQ
jgi:hypothetical protein